MSSSKLDLELNQVKPKSASNLSERSIIEKTTSLNTKPSTEQQNPTILTGQTTVQQNTTAPSKQTAVQPVQDPSTDQQTDPPTLSACLGYYDESEFEDLPLPSHNRFATWVQRTRESLIKLLDSKKPTLWCCFKILMLALYTAYFIWFLVCKSRLGTLLTKEENIRLIWMTCVFVLWLVYHYTMKLIVPRVVCLVKIIQCECCKDFDYVFNIVVAVISSIISVLLFIYIIYSAVKYDPYNLVSLIGIFLLLLFSYVFSVAPHMVNWRTVGLGILFQLTLAWLIIATHPGYSTFRFIGDRISEFLDHTEAGVKFVFGDKYYEHFFAFRILPVVVFVSTITSILYYLEVIQFMVRVLGMFMYRVLGTTAGESLNAVANIFLGMTESPLLIRPLLGRMTNSELHAVMTGGFATIAGSVLAAYINYGAPANHLISASVMSAPAALAVSKLMYPETKKSKTTKDDTNNMPKSPHKNIVEATTAGATDSIPIVASIAVTVMAFVSLLAFLNATLAWFGERACVPVPLSFEYLCSFIFWPLSFVMGVEFSDCRTVAELIGVKTFLNEFIAYSKLGNIKKNMDLFQVLSPSAITIVKDYNQAILTLANGTVITLNGGILYAERSLVITTYALCGFANFGSIGIMLSSLSAMIPHRRTDLSGMIVMAMIAGNIACFLTASIAGLFFKPS